MPSKTFNTPGPVRLSLEIPAGRIEVETVPGEETRVELEAVGGSELARELVDTARIDMLQRGEGQEVVVEARMRGGFWISFGRGPEVRLRVTCPTGADLDVRTKSADVEARGEYGSADVKTASGDVHVDEVAAGARVKTASGDVHLGHIGGTLDVNSASGDLHVGAVMGEANVQLVSGDIVIRDAGSSLSAATVSGDHRVEAVVQGRISLNAISGDISVGVRRGSRVFVDANTVSGSTSSELELSDSPSEEQTGEGGPLVELYAKAISGDVRIERAPAPSTTQELSEQP